jgi:hypothetical protein
MKPIPPFDDSRPVPLDELEPSAPALPEVIPGMGTQDSRLCPHQICGAASRRRWPSTWYCSWPALKGQRSR